MKLTVELFLFIVCSVIVGGIMLLWLIRLGRKESEERADLAWKNRPEIGFNRESKIEESVAP